VQLIKDRLSEQLITDRRPTFFNRS
jgi:hypothetical protein